MLIILGYMISDSVFAALHQYLRHSLENGLNRTVTQGNMTSIFLQDSSIYLKAVLPMMGAVMVIGIMASLLQTGFIRSLDPLKPDLNRLNPIQGFKNIFSQRAFYRPGQELSKAVAGRLHCLVFYKRQYPGNLCFLPYRGESGLSPCQGDNPQPDNQGGHYASGLRLSGLHVPALFLP